ncbi:MAG: sodium ion-translocating decarboxylase subunit beta [Chloroflexi bacterium]|nr:sodium ion-translocating decarboxylase subunit beta [Chloroflexota bacterium]
MMLVGGLMIFLAIAYRFEPLLLLPIGLGAMAVNLPLGGLTGEHGIMTVLKENGLDNELFPLLMFLGLGALTDFTPLLQRPWTFLLGGAAQAGIFASLMAAIALNFSLREAGAIAIIGSADGPTTIFVATQLCPDSQACPNEVLGPVVVAAYSYMAMVPLIQPPIMKLLTTKAERSIPMEYTDRPIPRLLKILFPIVVLIIGGLLAPKAAPLLTMFMFGNLLRESGVVDRLSNTAQSELINIVTILLGLVIGSIMTGDTFLQLFTLKILGLGLGAFVIGTSAGVMFGKLMMVVSGRKINPLIGAAGVSAVPMAARVVQRMGQKERPDNFLLMHAMGPNVAGVIGSALAGGVLLSRVPALAG